MANNNNYPYYHNSDSNQFGSLEDANYGSTSSNNLLDGNEPPSANLFPGFRPILGRRNGSMGQDTDIKKYDQPLVNASSLQHNNIMQKEVSFNSCMNIKSGIQQNAYLSDKKHNAEAGAMANRVQSCAFCVKNHETDEFARSHRLKDASGRVTCPVLRKHVCETCSATGDNAHTKTYCKYNAIGTQPIAKVLQSSERNSTGIRNKKKRYFNPSTNK